MEYIGIVWLISIGVVWWSDQGDCQTLVERNRCSITDTEQVAHIGWPFWLDCGLVLHTFDLSSGDGEHSGDEEVVFNCQILFRNGSVLFNATTDYSSLEYENTDFGFTLADLKENNTSEYDIVLTVPGTEICYVTALSLDIVPLQQLSCQESIKTELLSSEHTSLGTEVFETCDVADDEYPELHLNGVPSDTVSYKWLRNCSDESPPNIKNGEDLRISSVRFEDAGVYICAVTYKGMTRYVGYREICVSEPLTLNDPLLTCSSDVVFKSPGEDALFECVANLGTGTGQIGQDFVLEWEKVSSAESGLCFHSSENSSTATTTKECEFDFNQKCTLDHTAQAQFESLKADVPLRLLIRNIQAEDYGQYMINVLVPRKEGPITITAIVTLNDNVVPTFLTTAQIIGICIGSVVLFLLICVLLWMSSLYIRVYFKRMCGSYETEEREYAAFLSYPGFNELNGDNRDQVDNAAKKLRRVIEHNLGFRLLDDIRDPMLGAGHGEAIQAAIGNCHRVIIIPTKALANNDWNQLIFQQGFAGMIENQNLKLVFLLLPGMMDHVRQNAANEPWATLLRAMTANYVIPWRPNSCCYQRHRFRLQVEDALPKLRKNRGNRNAANVEENRM